MTSMVVSLPAAVGDANVPMLSEFGYIPMQSAKFIYLLTGANMQQALIDRSGNHSHGTVDATHNNMSYADGIITASNAGGAQINTPATITGPNFTLALVLKALDSDVRDTIRFANQTFGISIRTGNGSTRAVYFNPSESLVQSGTSGLRPEFGGYQFQILTAVADTYYFARNGNPFTARAINGGATQNVPNGSLIQIGTNTGAAVNPYHEFGFFGCWEKTFTEDDRQALYGYVRRLMAVKGVNLP